MLLRKRNHFSNLLSAVFARRKIPFRTWRLLVLVMAVWRFKMKKKTIWFFLCFISLFFFFFFFLKTFLGTQYAHRKCVQRWCNEKGDITCEICHQVTNNLLKSVFLCDNKTNLGFVDSCYAFTNGETNQFVITLLYPCLANCCIFFSLCHSNSFIRVPQLQN